MLALFPCCCAHQQVCDACNVGDVECINANRKKMGFLEIDKAEME